MARIPESFIREVIDRNSIEDIIGNYVELKRSSGNFVGLCPFHSEKTPSFTVFPDSMSFYCFGCGTGGDAITFISKIENLGYVDAVKLLAERANMTMPAEDPADAAASKMRETILRANKEAARFFHACLKNETLGKTAREYIAKRRLTADTVLHFGLGFSPDLWDGLTKHLLSKGFTETDILNAGLAKRSEKTGKLFDFFRNRLMFPIIDLRGNVIAFGGRVLDNSLPKYLNSGDSPVFSKKNNLFALNYAKNKGNDRLILAEGYMDVISMHQAGFTEAVATLGTAITPEHARLMSRYAKKIIVAYDTDQAGQKAVEKATKLLGELNVEINILAVSDGKDPDEFIRENGAEKFELLLNGAKNRLDYELGMIKRKFDITTPDGKIAYIKAASEIIAKESHSVTREVYAGVLAKETEVSVEQIKNDISRFLKTNEKRNKYKEFNDAGKKLKVPEVYNDRNLEVRVVRAEEGIIASLLKNNDYLYKFKELNGELFVTEKNRKIFSAISEKINCGETTEIYSFSGELLQDELSHLVGIEARSRISQKFTTKEMEDYIAVLKSSGESGKDVSSLSDDEFRNLIKKK